MNRPSIQTAWVLFALVVVLVFSGSAVLIFMSKSDIAIQAPSFSTSLAASIKEMLRLETAYANELSEAVAVRERWHLLCILVGAISAVAVAVRAPQPFILVGGSYTAFLVAAVDMSIPEQKVTALQKARTSLSCALPLAYEIQSMEDKHASAMRAMAGRLSETLPELQQNMVQLTHRLARLSRMNSEMSGQIADPQKQVESFLLRPLPETKSATEDLEALQREIYTLRFEISSYDLGRDEGLARDLNRLELTAFGYIDELSQPKTLQSSLESALTQVLDDVELIEAKQAEAERQLVASQARIRAVPVRVSETNLWLQQLSSTTQLANRVPGDVHAELLSKLSMTYTSAAQTVAALGNFSSPEIASVAFGEPEAHESGEPLPAAAAPMYGAGQVPASLLRKVEAIKIRAAKLWKQIEPSIKRAQQYSEKAEALLAQEVRVMQRQITVVKDQLQRVTQTLENLEVEAESVDRDLQRSEKIIRSSNLGSVEVAITSCTK